MRKQGNKHGFALMMVMIVLAVAVILGTTYLSNASVKMTSSKNLLAAA